jgi:DNA repair protein RecN (Recombination protein N)
VLTGETGAGKTMLAHALDLLLGGRARPGIVRPGAGEAWVEGVFERPDGLPADLEQRLPADSAELVVARRVGADGRTRAYLGGRSANLGDLRDAGEHLLAFYGQHEHRKLALASAQLEVLDSFCGGAQADRRARCAAAHAEARVQRAKLSELAELAGARDRELDLLEFELGEIEAAEPREGEIDDLTAERDRLRHLEGLRAGALGAAEAIAPESAEAGISVLLAEAERGLAAVDGVDPELDQLSERLRALRLEAHDLAGDLRRYEETVEAPAGRLEEVEDRLAVLSRLERKHGGSIAAVLAHAESCRVRRDELASVEDALDTARTTLEAAEHALAAAAAELRSARAEAAPALAGAVRERLAELAMDGAEFDVRIDARPGGPGPTGDDVVEFVIAPNPGVPAGPLRDIASGGETSRVMLALLGVAHGAKPRDGAALGDRRLLVFDEVDAGVGGQTARAVGSHLRALAAGRQIMCITHLPQIASHADRHFRISKKLDREPAVTTVMGIDGDEVVGELVRMLGGESDDRAARQHARELLRAA